MSKTTALIPQGDRFELTKTSLTMKDGTTLAQWEAMFSKLLEAEGSIQWWLGDMLRLGQISYAEAVSAKLSTPDGADGLKYQTFKNYKSVADRVPASMRMDALYWSLHEQIAAMPTAKLRKETLKLAFKEKWTFRQTRKYVRDWKAKDKKENPAPIPEGKYSIIYADPPWKYNDERNLDGYDTNAASNSYPTMPLDELGALPIKDLAADDCVLFLWVTAPMAPDGFALGALWGFHYKQQFVWDKVNPGMGGLGFYHMCNYEILLICTRGSPLPPEEKYDSVQVIKKSRKHSEKPEEFREIIDSMYPDGPRIELFRRGDAPDGWAVWGNEVVSL